MDKTKLAVITSTEKATELATRDLKRTEAALDMIVAEIEAIAGKVDQDVIHQVLGAALQARFMIEYMTDGKLAMHELLDKFLEEMK